MERKPLDADLHLRISPHLYKRLQRAAKADDRSVSNLVRRILASHFEPEKPEVSEETGK
jgi:predicted HicB family RNase H-like nuclease